jgi:hypothetical protein
MVSKIVVWVDKPEKIFSCEKWLRKYTGLKTAKYSKFRF